MAFWDSWFGPKCEACGTKIAGMPPMVHDGKKLCESCHGAAVELAARKAAEIEARRLAEEAARAKFEAGKQFGVDPRYKT